MSLAFSSIYMRLKIECAEPELACGTPALNTHPGLPQEEPLRASVAEEGAHCVRVPPGEHVLPCRRRLRRARRVAPLRFLPAVAAARHDLRGDVARSEVPVGAGDVDRDALHVDGVLAPVCHGVLHQRLPETGCGETKDKKDNKYPSTHLSDEEDTQQKGVKDTEVLTVGAEEAGVPQRPAVGRGGHGGPVGARDPEEAVLARAVDGRAGPEEARRDVHIRAQGRVGEAQNGWGKGAAPLLPNSFFFLCALCVANVELRMILKVRKYSRVSQVRTSSVSCHDWSLPHTTSVELVRF